MPVIHSFFSILALGATASAQLWPNTTFSASAYRDISIPSASSNDKPHTQSTPVYNTAISASIPFSATSTSIESRTGPSYSTIPSIPATYNQSIVISSSNAARSSENASSFSSIPPSSFISAGVVIPSSVILSYIRPSTLLKSSSTLPSSRTASSYPSSSIASTAAASSVPSNSSIASSYSYIKSSISVTAASSFARSSLPVASSYSYSNSSVPVSINVTNETAGFSCHDALIAWAATSSLLAVPPTSTVLDTTVYRPAWANIEYGVVDRYTMNNGTRRAQALNITSTQQYTVIESWPDKTTLYPSSWSKIPLPPSPSCTIDQNVCSSLWQNYAKQIGFQPSQTFGSIPEESDVSHIPTPLCTMDGAATCYTRRIDEGKPRCAFGAGKVQVYYWPPTQTKASMTQTHNNITQLMTEAPRSVVVDGSTTIVSPDMAIYFESMKGSSTGAEYVQCANSTTQIYRWWASDIGQTHSSVWVTGLPFSFKSYERAMNGDTFPATAMPIFNASKFDDGDPLHNPGGIARFPDAAITAMMKENASDYSFWATQIYSADLVTTVPVNPADFVQPNPRAYYLRPFDIGGHQQGCNKEGAHPHCSIIFDQSYSAQIYVPSEVRSLDPAWAFCDPHYKGAVDPPEALTQSSEVFVPVTTTSAGGPTMLSAMPIDVPNAPTVTASPQIDLINPSPTATAAVVAQSNVGQEVSGDKPTSSSISIIVTQIIIPSQVINQTPSTPQDDSNPSAAVQPSQNAAGQQLDTLNTQTVATHGLNAQQNQAQGPIPSMSNAVLDPAAASVQSALAPVVAPNVVSASVSGFSIVLSGQTLTPGAPTTINGQVVSQLPGGNSVVISAASPGGTATTVHMTPGASAMTIGSQTQALAPVVTPNLVSASLAGSQVVVSGQTLQSGSQITINGQVISQLSAGNSIIVSNPADGHVTRLTINSAGNIFTVGSQTGAALPMSKVGNDIVIAGSTLHPGSALTYAGKTISMDTSGSSAYVNGIYVPLTADSFSYHTSGGTIYGVTKSPEPLQIGSSTLKPGSAITYSGQTISLDASGSTAYVNGKAVSLTSGTASFTAGGTVYAVSRTGNGRIGGSAVSTIARTSSTSLNAKSSASKNGNGPGIAGYVVSGMQPPQPTETHSDAPPKGAAQSLRIDRAWTTGLSLAIAMILSWHG